MLYVNVIDEIHILEMWELGDILLTYSGFRSGRTYVELAAPQLTIWVLVVQWLERLIGHQKVAG